MDVPSEIDPSGVSQGEAAPVDPPVPAPTKEASAALPATPAQMHLGGEALDKLGSLAMSLRKVPPSPTKSSSPTKSLFLTKDSNLTNFAGWDVDGRLNEFESQVKAIKEVFEGTMTDRKAFEEAIDLAKNRGMYAE